MTFQYYCRVNMVGCQRQKNSPYPLLVKLLTEQNVLPLKTLLESAENDACGARHTRVAFWIQAVWEQYATRPPKET